MNFDMNTCWTRSVALLSGNFQLLIVIAGMFVLLPTVAMYLLVPDFQMLMDPSADEEALAAQLQANLVPLLTTIGIATLFQFAGYGAMVALMGDARPTVGEALGKGIRVVPSLIAVMLLFGLVYVIGSVLILLPISLLVGVAGVPALGLIGVVPVVLFIVWLMARLSMSLPAMVLGDTLNPLSAMSGSFALTKSKQWQILLFWAVLVAIFFVVSMLFNGVIGVIAAMFGSGTTALLVMGLANGLTGMISGMLMCAVAVAMYGQLSGPSQDTIESTFE